MSEDRNKKGLGRGLMSLFGDQEESIKKKKKMMKQKKITIIPIYQYP